MPVSISHKNTRLFLAAQEAINMGRVLHRGLGAVVGRLSPAPLGPDSLMGVDVQTMTRIIRASWSKGLVIDRKV